MFCTNCGKQLPDTAVFCTNCGNPVKKPVAPNPIPVPSIPVAEEVLQPKETIPAVEEAIQPQNAIPVAEEAAAVAAQEVENVISDIPQPQIEVPEAPVEIPAETIPQAEMPQVEIPSVAAPVIETAQTEFNAQIPGIPQPEAAPYPAAGFDPNYDPNANYNPQQPVAQQGFVPPYPPQGGDAPVKQKKEKGPKKSIFKNKFFYIGLAAAVLVIVGVVLFLVLGGTTTYDLKDYVKVEYDGYEGNGEAYVSIDKSALQDKIYEDKKITLDDISSLSGYAKMLKKASEIDEALSTIHVYADPKMNLKNGDEITVTFEFDNDVAKKQKLKFIGEEQKITVEGLPELMELDPFAGLTVTFEGISGDGTARFEYSGTDDLLNEYSFDIEGDAQQYYLKNGDEITVVVESYYDDETAAYYGLKLTKREQKYTVSGLSEYISEFSQISASGMEILRGHAEEDLNDALDDVDSAYTMGTPEYCGYALGVANSEDEYTRNYLYLIYKAKVGGVAGKTMPTTLYMPVKFDNVTNDDELNESYSYGVKGYERLIGSSDYFSGYFDPYAMVKEIYESYSEYTFTFGDGIEAYNTDPVSVTSLSDIPQETLTAAYDYVIERAKQYVKDHYLTTTTASEFAGVGEYVYVSNDASADIKDRAILVTVVKMKVVDEEKGVNTVVYMPFEFDGILKTNDGVYHLSYGSDVFSNDMLAEDYETAGMLDLKQLDTLLKSALADTYSCTPSETMKKAVG